MDSKELLLDPYKTLVELLIKGPKDSTLSAVIPENTKVLNANLSGKCVTLDLSKEFMLHDDVMSLEDGYNTKLGTRGIKLSKGQNQRLILTRSFVKPKKIMIFDDSFSAIDNKNKKEILKDLLYKKDNFTKVIVSYDISIAPLFDKVLYIENKKIICDTHDNLLKNNSSYKKIYEIGMDKVGDAYE